MSPFSITKLSVWKTTKRCVIQYVSVTLFSRFHVTLWSSVCSFYRGMLHVWAAGRYAAQSKLYSWADGTVFSLICCTGKKREQQINTQNHKQTNKQLINKRHDPVTSVTVVLLAVLYCTIGHNSEFKNKQNKTAYRLAREEPVHAVVVSKVCLCFKYDYNLYKGMLHFMG